jgi:hypothetical protein
MLVTLVMESESGIPGPAVFSPVVIPEDVGLPLPLSTWLLVWNPDRFEWSSEQMREAIARLDSGEDEEGRWSAGVTRGLRRGDRCYFVRLGSEPRGIFASGRILTDVQVGAHWDKEQAALGKSMLYVVYRLDELLDPSATAVLSVKRLTEQFPTVTWNPQASGTHVPDQACRQLEVEWQQHLARAGASRVRLVSRRDQLHESICSFDDALHAKRKDVQFAVFHPDYWVSYAKRKQVAPAIWAALRGMCPEIYSALQETARESGGSFRGVTSERTWPAIEKLTGRRFAANSALSEQLARRFTASFGEAFLGNRKLDALRWLELGSPDRAGGHVQAQNVILFGPPGTGKTYATALRAVRLCDGIAEKEDRAALMRRYRELSKAGRIEFVTFHQSYSYEDFVEGIRPVVATAGNASGAITYECRDGVFKQLCATAARTVSVGVGWEAFDPETAVWKMSIGQAGAADDEELYAEALAENHVSLGWGGTVDFSDCADESAIAARLAKQGTVNAAFEVTAVDRFKNKMQVGDLVVISSGLHGFRAIARVAGPYQFRAHARHCQIRPVEWLVVFDEAQPIERLYRKQLSQATIYRLAPATINVEGLRDVLRSPRRDGELPAYVLVIDEINRGNVAKILGELITLLEPDKRIGAENELQVRLPYSGSLFGVPANLHLVGTMNSADRSIALLDTALRRRFRFEEIRPDPGVIRRYVGNGGTVDGIDVARLLGVLNDRIELLLDREHALGHAFFLRVKTLADLRDVVRHEILPLLQEFFFDDWGKICAVLGCAFDDDGVQSNPNPVVQAKHFDRNLVTSNANDWERKLRCTVCAAFLDADGDALRPFLEGMASPGDRPAAP